MAETTRAIRYIGAPASAGASLVRARPAAVVRAGSTQVRAADAPAPGLSLDDLARLLGASRDDASSLPVVWGCLVRIISRLQNMPVRITNPDGSLARTPAWVTTPSMTWDWADVISQSAWSLLMEGDLFVLPTRDRLQRPIGVVIVDPRKVQTYKKVGQDILPQLVYTINGAPAPGLIHVRYVALPGEPRGLGSKRAAKRAAEIGVMSEQTILNHFVQGARLQAVFTAKSDKITPEQAREATFELQANYGGLDNAWKPVAIGGDYAVNMLSQTADDAQFLELSQWSDARIASQIFGVDPTLLGINISGSSLTYKNASDRESQLWRDALRPVATRIESCFARLLTTGRRFDLVESSVLIGGPRDRALYAKDLAQINRMAGAWIFTPNQILEAVGLPTRPEGELPETLPYFSRTQATTGDPE